MPHRIVNTFFFSFVSNADSTIQICRENDTYKNRFFETLVENKKGLYQAEIRKYIQAHQMNTIF